MREQIKKLSKTKEKFAKRLEKAKNLGKNSTFQRILRNFSTLAAIFTLLQFREYKKDKMGRRFTREEKVMALSLYKSGPRAYRLLRKIFVLPAPVTLSRMVSRANLKLGLNENLFDQLKKCAKKMKPDDRLCTLIFDEMAISPHFDYSKKRDQVIGFTDDGHHTKKQITRLQSTGFKVLATVCDQGASNVSAINHLIEETRIKYIRKNEELRNAIFEVDNEKIVPLYDVRHLLKARYKAN